jgi:hypothetical protein
MGLLYIVLSIIIVVNLIILTTWIENEPVL